MVERIRRSNDIVKKNATVSTKFPPMPYKFLLTIIFMLLIEFLLIRWLLKQWFFIARLKKRWKSNFKSEGSF